MRLYLDTRAQTFAAWHIQGYDALHIAAAEAATATTFSPPMTVSFVAVPVLALLFG